jgi:hypothetical protein
MRLTNLIRRDVFMTSGELAIPGGVFMAGGGPGGVVGGVRSAYLLKYGCVDLLISSWKPAN